MKTHKILTAVCCLLTLAVCAQAQVSLQKTNKKDNAQIEKVLQKRIMQARANQKAKCYKCGETILDKYHQDCAKGGICQAAPAQARKSANPSPYTGKDPHAKVAAVKAQANHVCAACGEEIHSAGQHCAATGYTTLCSSSKAEPAAKNVQEDSSICPKCGKALSIDERYHGVEHHCQAAAPVCAACGEEIHSAGQHCAATGYTTLCSSSKAEPAAQKVQEDSSVCPKCGKALSIDERYHGVEHHCQAVKAETKNVCASCGEEVRPGQHCAATGYNTLCSSSKQETKYQPVENNYNGGDPHANEVF